MGSINRRGLINGKKLWGKKLKNFNFLDIKRKEKNK